MKKEQMNRYREEEQNEENKESVLEASQVETPEVNEDPLQLELQKVNNAYLRVLADYENFKKRTQEERIKERKYQYQELFEKLVNLVDLFDKAVNTPTEDEKMKNFLIGFSMINKHFQQILEAEGVKKIKALNEVFNPVYHHAIETQWDETKPENQVMQELQTGYLYKDRVLRPSLVKVNLKTKGNEEHE